MRSKCSNSEKLIQGSHHKRVADIAGTGSHQFLIHKVSMMLHKKGHHHYNRSGIALPERVHLPDRRKEANELMDEFFPADAIPSNIFQPLKSLIEIFFYPVIVAVPTLRPASSFSRFSILIMRYWPAHS